MQIIMQNCIAPFDGIGSKFRQFFHEGRKVNTVALRQFDQFIKIVCFRKTNRMQAKERLDQFFHPC